MNELKLRVFKNGKMYGHSEAIRLLYNKEILLEQDEFIIMLFTGLKDCKGKDIHEGDVCKFKDDKTSDVIFKDGEFQNRLSEWGLHIYMKCPYTSKQIAPGIEVIGNIYSNPELLK